MKGLLYGTVALTLLILLSACSSGETYPPAGTPVGEYWCQNYSKFQEYHDGKGGTYIVEEKLSEDCGYEEPVVVFKMTLPTGDRFNPVVVEVSYEQFGKPVEGLILDWWYETTDDTIGWIERPDEYTLLIHGDGRVGEGTIILNDEDFRYSIEAEPRCAHDDIIDCLGYRVSKNSLSQGFIYYGEDDDYVVTFELTIFEYEGHVGDDDLPVGLISNIEDDGTSNLWKKWRSRVEKFNELYEYSGVYAKYELKEIWTAHFHGLHSLEDLATEVNADIVLGAGTTYPNTCGVAYPNYRFTEGWPVTSMAACGWTTDLHEIGHSIGLAHGPENQSFQSSGYIFPQFGHGWNDVCGDHDDLMSYGTLDDMHSNSLLTCGELLGTDSKNIPDDIAGNRQITDTAYAINRVRYDVSLINDDNKYKSKADARVRNIERLDRPIIID